MSGYRSEYPIRTSPSGRAHESDFVGDLNEAVRQNPIPAALIGAGIMWLFFGRAKDARLGAASGSLFRHVGSGARWAGETTANGLHAGAASVAAGASELGAQAKRAAAASAEALGAAGNSVASSVQGAAHSVGDKVSSAISSGGPSYDPESGSFTRRSAADSIQQDVAELLHRQPLAVGAAALALGAALAACIRTTDAERQVMGEAAGSLVGEAKKRLDGAMGEVAAMARNGAGQASDFSGRPAPSL